MTSRTASITAPQALQSAAAQRRTLNLRLIAVEEEERRRLARELHDELGQCLTAIKVDAAYMEREARGVLPGVVSCARGVGRSRRQHHGADPQHAHPTATA